MQRILTSVCALWLAGCYLAGAVAHGAEFVQFEAVESAATGPTIEPFPSTPVLGFLSRPLEPGAHPVVLLLTDCRGRHAYHEWWARSLSAQGFVALVVDHYFMRAQREHA